MKSMILERKNGILVRVIQVSWDKMIYKPTLFVVLVE